MSSKKLDLRFLSLFAPLSIHQPKLSNCDKCDCDCYSKSCYCDRSPDTDEENTDTGRCDSSDKQCDCDRD